MVADDVARGLPERSTAHLRALVTDPTYLWEVEVPETVRPGTASGPLVGGRAQPLQRLKEGFTRDLLDLIASRSRGLAA